jgi:hypothetical protein
MNFYDEKAHGEIDLDYVVSKNTLAYLEKTLLDYKKRILKDLSENINVSFETLETEFLERPAKTKKILFRGKDRTKICDDKCMARIWHKELGPIQCSRSKKVRDFCGIHIKNLNYGRIDESL